MFFKGAGVLCRCCIRGAGAAAIPLGGTVLTCTIAFRQAYFTGPARPPPVRPSSSPVYPPTGVPINFQKLRNIVETNSKTPNLALYIGKIVLICFFIREEEFGCRAAMCRNIYIYI